MMLNVTGPEARTTSSASSSVVTAEKALSFIYKGLREVRSSADADLQLIKNRANSFKNIADRELENFLNSASRSTFAAPTISASATTAPAEIDFVKKLRPKLTEFRRAYSSPDFKWSQWSPKPKIAIDLSAIKNAIGAEVEEEEDERVRFRRWKVRFKEGDREEGQFGELWEAIRAFKTRLREFEQKSSSSLPVDIFEGIKNSELVVKVKSSLVLSSLNFRLVPFTFFMLYIFSIFQSTECKLVQLKFL